LCGKACYHLLDQPQQRRNAQIRRCSAQTHPSTIELGAKFEMRMSRSTCCMRRHLTHTCANTNETGLQVTGSHSASLAGLYFQTSISCVRGGVPSRTSTLGALKTKTHFQFLQTSTLSQDGQEGQGRGRGGTRWTDEERAESECRAARACGCSLERVYVSNIQTRHEVLSCTRARHHRLLSHH
jgi:hypothetical protein